MYGVKGVAAIPLVEERARTALNTIASRNGPLPRSSLVRSTTLDAVSDARDSDTTATAASDAKRAELVGVPTDDQKRSAPRVKFSSDEQVKFAVQLATPSDGDETTSLRMPASSSSRSSLSDQSADSFSERSVSTSPVAKTLASRLSFWSRLEKRTSFPSINQTEGKSISISEPSSLLGEQAAVDNLIMEEGNEEPARVVDGILAATAPPSASVEEKQSELERKIIRECIKEFSKGRMYFAYTFGKYTAVNRTCCQLG